MEQPDLVEKSLRDHLASVVVRAEAKGKSVQDIAADLKDLWVRSKFLPEGPAGELARRIRTAGSADELLARLDADPAAAPLLARRVRVKTASRKTPPVTRGSLLDAVGEALRHAVEARNFKPEELRAKATQEGIPVWRAAKQMRRHIRSEEAAEITMKAMAGASLRPPSPWASLDKALRLQLGDKRFHAEDIPVVQSILWEARQGGLRKLLAAPTEVHSLRVALHRTLSAEIQKARANRIPLATALKTAVETLNLVRGAVTVPLEKVARIAAARFGAGEVTLGLADPSRSLDRLIDILSEQAVTWDNPHTGQQETCPLRKVLSERVVLAKEETRAVGSTREIMEKLAESVDTIKQTRKESDTEPAIAAYLRGNKDEDWRGDSDFDISKDEVKAVAGDLAVTLQRTRRKIRKDEDDRRQGKPRTATPDAGKFKGIGMSAAELVAKANAGRNLREEIRETMAAAATASREKDEIERHTESGIRIKREARTYGGAAEEGWTGEGEPADKPAGRVVIEDVNPADKNKLVEEALKAEERKGAKKRPPPA